MTKSGQRLNQHEMVSVDDAFLVQWLSKGLCELLPGDPIVAQTPQAFRKLFYGSIRVLGLTRMEYKPYSLRRGGATHHYRVFGYQWNGPTGPMGKHKNCQNLYH